MTALQHNPTKLRRHDWPERLAALLAERMAAPFAWGANDCCLFAADALHAQWGIDVASHLRGHYSSAAEAARVLQQEGGVRGIANQVLGQPLPLASLAQRGDVACVCLEGRDTLGVVLDSGQWAAPGPNGLFVCPLPADAVAWRV